MRLEWRGQRSKSTSRAFPMEREGVQGARVIERWSARRV